MEDNDFDKIYAHKFGQAPDKPYEDDTWSDLSIRLDAFERRRKRWMFPILLPLFGLMAGGNVFWWHQWRMATQQQPIVSGKTTQLLPDTFVKTREICRHDTIYRYISLTKTPCPTLPARKSPSPEAAEPGMLPDANIAAALPAIFDRADKPIVAVKVVTPGVTLQPAPPDTGRTVFAVDTLAAVEKVVADTKIRKSAVFYIARPRLGLTTAWSSPMLLHKRSGHLWGAGLDANVEVAQHIRLAAALMYWQGRLKADETDALQGIRAPNPGDDYKLKYWETYRLPTFTYALSIRYDVPSGEKWKPWLSLGMQAITILPFEIEFDFENPGNNLEIFLPGQAVASTHLQGIRVAMGIETPLGARWTFGAEAALLQHLGKNPGILDNQFGLQTNLQYNF